MIEFKTLFRFFYKYNALTGIQLETKPTYRFLIVYYSLQEIKKKSTKPQEFVYQKTQTIKQWANWSKLVSHWSQTF